MQNKRIKFGVVVLSYSKSLYFYNLLSQTLITLCESNQDYDFTIKVVETNKNLEKDLYSNHEFIACENLMNLSSKENLNLKTMNYTDFLFIESFAGASLTQRVNIEFIYPDTSFGFNRNMNIGIRALDLTNNTYEMIGLLNNDLIFKKDCLKPIVEAFEKHKDLMSASPFTQGWHCHEKDFRNKKGIIFGYRRSWHICGWCLFIRPETLKILGDFDEQFDFFCQDDDYAEMLKKFKLSHALIRNSEIEHITSASHDLLDNKDYMTNGMIKKFYEKWKKWP